MPGFSTHTGRSAVYTADQVDTDRIIPARYLSRVSRMGYGDLLFNDVRGPGFPLDAPEAQGATILVAGTNFGCGSSREHAVWAIQQAGFVAVIAKITAETSGYSDIFRQNAANCGLLLVELGPEDHAHLEALGSGAEVSLDLPNQTVSAGGRTANFGIAPAVKKQLMAGRDLIGTTLEHEGAISAYEGSHSSFAPDTVGAS